MRADRIKELQWVKENKQILSPEEIKRLEDIGVFDFIIYNEVKLPLCDMIYLLNDLDNIIFHYENF